MAKLNSMFWLVLLLTTLTLTNHTFAEDGDWSMEVVSIDLAKTRFEAGDRMNADVRLNPLKTTILGGIKLFIVGKDGRAAAYTGSRLYLVDYTYTWGMHDYTVPCVLPKDMPDGEYTVNVQFFDTAGEEALSLPKEGPTISVTPYVGVILNINNGGLRPDNDPPAGPVEVGLVVPGSVYVSGECSNWNVVAQITRRGNPTVLSSERFSCNDPAKRGCLQRFTSLKIPAGQESGVFRVWVKVTDGTGKEIEREKFFINGVSDKVITAALNVDGKYSGPNNDPSALSSVKVGTRIPGIVVIKGECSNWNVVAEVTRKGSRNVINTETLRCNSPSLGACYLGLNSLTIPDNQEPGVFRIWVHVKDSAGNELQAFRFFINGVSDAVTPNIGASLTVNYKIVRPNNNPLSDNSFRVGSRIPGRLTISGRGSNWNVLVQLTKRGSRDVLSSETFTCSPSTLNKCYLAFRSLTVPAGESAGVYRIWVHVRDSGGNELQAFRFFINVRETVTPSATIDNIVVPETVLRAGNIDPLPVITVSNAINTRIHADLLMRGSERSVSHNYYDCKTSPCVMRPYLGVPLAEPVGSYRLRVIVKDSGGNELARKAMFFNVVAREVDVDLNVLGKRVGPDNDPASLGRVSIGSTVPGSIIIDGGCASCKVFAGLTKKGDSDVINEEVLYCPASAGTCTLGLSTLKVPAGSSPGTYRMQVRVFAPEKGGYRELTWVKFFFNGK